MQKNKNIIFFFFFFFMNANAEEIKEYEFLDRKSIFCQNEHDKDTLIFIFNNDKVFKLEYIRNNKDLIHDEFFSFKNLDELGSSFLYKEGKLYWNKNPWNNYYQFAYDVKEKTLKQRHILKKNKLNSIFADLTGKSSYYLKVNKFKCVIINNWEELKVKLKKNYL